MSPPLAADRTVQPSLRHRWKGPWLLAVAALHMGYAFVVFTEPLREIVRRGVLASVRNDPLLGAVVWFVLFGLLFALLAWVVLQLERHGGAAAAATQRPLGFGLLALALLGIVLMPPSGFWLVLPPALALCAAQPLPTTPSTAFTPDSRKTAS